jgi:hypothetical protein
VPATGKNVGEAIFTGRLIVYVAVAVSLSVIPSLNALALIVFVASIARGPEYAVDVAEGSDPSVVYLMVAPDVEQLIVTVWTDV